MALHFIEPFHRSQRRARQARGWRRRTWSFEPRIGWLEVRALLAGDPSNLMVGAATLTLDSPVGARIAPLAAAYYQISLSTPGELTVVLQSPGLAARISLVDQEGQPLVQSDASETGAPDGLIDASVPAGVEYVEVQSLSGGGSYQITASLVAADPAFTTVPSQFGSVAPIAVGDFYGNGVADLVAPDGIHLGVGDGTFQSTVVDGPLAQNGWNVTAITVADFNDDGLPDIAFAETSPDGMTALVRVLQNEGAGRFQDVATFPVDPQTSAIQAIDFGGGIMELAAASIATGQVQLFLAVGTGQFTPVPGFSAGIDPSAMVSGNFGDGHLDLIIADEGATFTGAGQQLMVFQSDGIGEFQLSGTIAVGSGPSALAAADFTGDGVLDLAVAESSSDDVSVLMNDGHGTFTTVGTYAVGSLPLALVAADFGNGHIDLATANANSDDVSVLVGNGDGTFQAQTRFRAGTYPEALVTADFNGDDRPDLAVANLKSGDISVLLGSGDGTFDDQFTNPVGNDPTAVVTADLNDDGHLDIITANNLSNDISVLLGNGDGTFQAAETFAAGAGPTALVLGDFNGDGLLDVAVADSGNNSGGHGQGVSILMGNGNGTFRSPVFYAAGANPSSIVAGDFTGNGVLDLAVANLFSDDVTILIGDGHGGFDSAPLSIPLGDESGGPVSIAAGHFTGNGALDLAVLDQSTETVSILRGNGQGGFPTSTSISLGDDPLVMPMALATGNFTGDGLSDLAVVSESFDESVPDSVSIIPGSTQGNLAVTSTISLGMKLEPTSITTGRFFGSGFLDLAIADSNTDQVSLLRGNGVGGFDPPSELSVGGVGRPTSITMGDYTGDGKLDLAIALQSPSSVAIELNQGSGQFAAPGPVGLVPRNTPVVADFTGDGVPDVAIVDGAGEILFRQGIGNEPGSFEPPIIVNTGYPSRDITAFVTNRGIWLASVDATDNAVSLFAYQNGQFTFLGKLATGPDPAQIVAADLNGNNEDGLIIRNAGDGTLTIYMTSANPPRGRLHAARHSGSRHRDIGRFGGRHQPGRPPRYLAGESGFRPCGSDSEPG